MPSRAQKEAVLKKLSFVLAFFCILAALATPAWATILTFEDLGNSGSLSGSYPNPPGINVWGTNWKYAVESMMTAGLHPSSAGGHAVYFTGLTAILIFPVAENFQGLWISSLSGETVGIMGYRSSSPVYSASSIGPAGTFLNLNWSNINRLDFTVSVQYEAVFDDFSYTAYVPTPPAVPIPGTAFLLGSGLLPLSLVAWRRRHRQ